MDQNKATDLALLKTAKTGYKGGNLNANLMQPFNVY